MTNVRNLRAGFTGDITAEDGIVSKARTVAGQVRDEAGSAAAAARDHQATMGSAFVLFGAVAFVAGYILGGSAARTSEVPDRWWR